MLGWRRWRCCWRDMPDGFTDHVAEVRPVRRSLHPDCTGHRESDGVDRLAGAWAQTVGIRPGEPGADRRRGTAVPVPVAPRPDGCRSSIVLGANLDKHAIPARVEAERVALVLPCQPTYLNFHPCL